MTLEKKLNLNVHFINYMDKLESFYSRIEKLN